MKRPGSIVESMGSGTGDESAPLLDGRPSDRFGGGDGGYEGQDDPKEPGEVVGVEVELTPEELAITVQALEAYRETLLDEAAAPILDQKLSRKDGTLGAAVERGLPRLAELRKVDELADKLRAVIP